MGFLVQNSEAHSRRCFVHVLKGRVKGLLIHYGHQWITCKQECLGMNWMKEVNQQTF